MTTLTEKGACREGPKGGPAAHSALVYTLSNENAKVLFLFPGVANILGKCETFGRRIMHMHVWLIITTYWSGVVTAVFWHLMRLFLIQGTVSVQIWKAWKRALSDCPRCIVRFVIWCRHLRATQQLPLCATGPGE